MLSDQFPEPGGVAAYVKAKKDSKDLRAAASRNTVTIPGPTSELYNDAGGNPALAVLGVVAELSHKPICLHQAKSDPFPKPEV